MSVSHPPTTTLSTKGQVILPKPIRDALGWDAGARLAVERTSEGVLLKPVASFPETDPERGLRMPPVRRRAKVPGRDGVRGHDGSQAAPCGRLIPTLSSGI